MNSSKTLRFVAAVCFALSMTSACAQKSPWQAHMEAGDAAYKMGKYAEAEKAFDAARAEAEKGDPKDGHLAKSLNELAKVYLKQHDRYMEAQPLCQRALDLQETAFGKDSPQVEEILNTLARDYDTQCREAYADGHFVDRETVEKKSEATFKRALAIGEKTTGHYQLILADTLSGLGNFYVFESHNEKAEPLFKRALEVREKLLGKEHPDVAQTLNDLATVEFQMSWGDEEKKQQKLKDATEMYKRALAIREKALGSQHPELAKTLCSLGEVEQQQNNYKEAEEHLRRAVSIDEKNSVIGAPTSEAQDKLIYLHDVYAENALLKPISVDGFKYEPIVDKESPKGFKLYKGDKVILKRELEHEYPYEYANISVVAPLAKARLKQDLDLESKWGGSCTLTGDQLSRLPIINNLTGTTSSIIVGTFSGGMNSCCTDYEILALGEQATPLPSLEGRNVYNFKFGDFHGDGQLYAIGQDMTWAYWNASMADSTLPGVVLKYTPKGWHLSIDDMKVKTIPQEDVGKAIEHSKKLRAASEQEYPPEENVFSIGSQDWTVMLNMIYAGHANDAWKYLDSIWPADKVCCSQSEDGYYLNKEKFIKSLKDNLHKSPYWNELLILNEGQTL